MACPGASAAEGRTLWASLALLSCASLACCQNVTGFLPDAIWLEKPDNGQCVARFASHAPVTVLMVADPGQFSNTSEAIFLEDNLQNTKIAPPVTTLCLEVRTGTLLGQPVVIALSGIGPEAAALCTTYILECASQIKDFIYVGTSGWSAQRGGLLNAPGPCTSAHGATPRVRLGDVAITPYSVAWTCKRTSWTKQCTGFPNVCSYPQEDVGPLAADLLGQCEFTTHIPGSLALSNELVAATKSAAFATNIAPLAAVFNSTILPYETAYWAQTQAGAGITYPPFPAWSGPGVLDYTQSVEIDSQFFFSGSPYDMVARNYSATTLNLANNSTLTQYDVTAVNAEEGVGVSYALNLHNGRIGAVQIPYTYVRGSSDYLYNPAQQVMPGVWQDVPNPPSSNFGSQYLFAIQTTSAVVLTALQARCNAAGNPLSVCSYTLPLTSG